jgi:hypothetical protein
MRIVQFIQFLDIDPRQEFAGNGIPEDSMLVIQVLDLLSKSHIIHLGIFEDRWIKFYEIIRSDVSSALE